MTSTSLLRVDNVMNVLAVGAHPDDVEIMCGGTLVKHVLRGDDVYILVLCNEYLNSPAPVRQKEAMESGKRLGAKEIIFGNLKDGHVDHSIDTIRIIEEQIHRIDADTVYTTSVHDNHQDHINVAYATLSAARRHKRVLCCETPSTLQKFSPQIYVDISETFDWKIDALRAHESQIGRSISLDAVTTISRFRGTQIFVAFAEAFEPHRYLLW